MSIEVANTILSQLGGRSRLAAMIGAHSFSADGNALIFKIKARAKHQIKAVRITLDPSDDYTVAFFSQKGPPTHAVKKVAEYSGIYTEGLVSVIERETGLALRL